MFLKGLMKVNVMVTSEELKLREEELARKEEEVNKKLGMINDILNHLADVVNHADESNKVKVEFANDVLNKLAEKGYTATKRRKVRKPRQPPKTVREKLAEAEIQFLEIDTVRQNYKGVWSKHPKHGRWYYCRSKLEKLKREVEHLDIMSEVLGEQVERKTIKDRRAAKAEEDLLMMGIGVPTPKKPKKKIKPMEF